MMKQAIRTLEGMMFRKKRNQYVGSNQNKCRRHPHAEAVYHVVVTPASGTVPARAETVELLSTDPW